MTQPPQSMPVGPVGLDLVLEIRKANEEVFLVEQEY